MTKKKEEPVEEVTDTDVINSYIQIRDELKKRHLLAQAQEAYNINKGGNQ